MKMSRRLDFYECQRRNLFDMAIRQCYERRYKRILAPKSLVCCLTRCFYRFVPFLNIGLLIISCLSVKSVDCEFVSNRTHPENSGEQLADLIQEERSYDLIQLRESGRDNQKANRNNQTSEVQYVEDNNQGLARQSTLQAGAIAKQRQNYTLKTIKSKDRANVLGATSRLASEREIRAKNKTNSIQSAIYPQESKFVPRLESAPVGESQEQPTERLEPGTSNDSELDNVEDDDEYGEQESEVAATRQGEKPTASSPRDQLDGRASVTSRASVDNGQLDEQQPSRMVTANQPSDRQSLLAIENDDERDSAQSGSSSDGSDKQEDETGLTPEAEAAERRELEAAEASEADEANRSALAEQQQQQREIIKAQAESEAKAIREQQNALLKQQQLQQQMLMRRHLSLIEGDAKVSQRQTIANKGREQPDRKQEHRSAAAGEKSVNRARNSQVRNINQKTSPRSDSLRDRRRNGQQQRDVTEQENRMTPMIRFDDSGDQQTTSTHLADNLFSDQDDDKSIDPNASNNGRQYQKYSQAANRQAVPKTVRRHDQASNVEPQDQEPEIAEASNIHRVSMDERLNSIHSSDLMEAAQHHHYGTHFGSIDAHHGNLGTHLSDRGHHKGGGYHQFAESHKKGQYVSGFKRGNKKFSISGHSSQHKNHAQGHVKWHGKKGKGSHKWDYQHSNKKHYGSGFDYGGGHYHY